MRTKTHTILCLLLVVVTGTFGQNIDSLKIELKNANNDTTRCNILSVIVSIEGWEKYNEDYLLISEKNVERKSQPIKFFKNHLIEALNNKAITEGYKGNIPKAISCLSKAIKLSEDIGDNPVEMLINIGVLYKEQGDIDASLIQLRKANEIAKKTNKKVAEIASLDFIIGVRI